MSDNYWSRQTTDKPLYPDLLWSRPENKQRAGKLLIVGGDAHGFGAPGEAYAAATSTGVGTARVVLPDSVKKLVPKEMQLEIEFLAGIKNGSFARAALGELLEAAAWADVVLLAGGVGRNSETSTLFERFVQEFNGRLVVTEDVLDLLHNAGLLNRPETVVAATLGQLQKLWPHTDAPVVTHSDSLMQFVEKLQMLSLKQNSAIVTVHAQQKLVAYQGQVSTTPSADDVWRIKTAARAATWWAWTPAKPFEAITTCLVT